MMKPILLAATLALLAPVSAIGATMPPRDQCAADPSLAAFRAQLKGIVKRKDAPALLALTSPNISWSFGGDSGRVSFAKEWKLNGRAGANSRIWRALDAVLGSGCSLKQGLASAPYWHASGPTAGDISEIGVVSRPRVNLRAGPSLTARVVRLVDYEVLTIITSDGGWTHARLSDGTEGWISNDYLWTGYSYRALFERRGGRWAMTAFIAGD